MAAIVKAQGATYPAVQLVFLRAVIGLLAIAPLVWRHRARVIGARRPARHLFRVACNAAALTGDFAALAALPLALVTAIGFTRPLDTMALAVLLLGERVAAARWLYAVAGLVAVVAMVAPGVAAAEAGLLAARASVLFGSLATVQTRALGAESPTTLMVFYTLGLGILTAPFAATAWVPVAGGDVDQELRRSLDEGARLLRGNVARHRCRRDPSGMAFEERRAECRLQSAQAARDVRLDGVESACRAADAARARDRGDEEETVRVVPDRAAR